VTYPDYIVELAKTALPAVEALSVLSEWFEANGQDETANLLRPAMVVNSWKADAMRRRMLMSIAESPSYLSPEAKDLAHKTAQEVGVNRICRVLESGKEIPLRQWRVAPGAAGLRFRTSEQSGGFSIVPTSPIIIRAAPGCRINLQLDLFVDSGMPYVHQDGPRIDVVESASHSGITQWVNEDGDVVG